MTAAWPDTFALLDRHGPDTIVAYRHGRAIRTAAFLDDVARVRAAMDVVSGGRHVLNTCADRYCFAVGLSAILVSGRISLLPSTLTHATIAQLRALTPDAFEFTDHDAGALGLPAVAYPETEPKAAAGTSAQATAMQTIPQIRADALVAHVFTSGSTGLPVPHRKTWGALVHCVRAEGTILGLRNEPRPAILGTVPPQHMYGFESTVLVALQSGAPFTAARPLFPADICAELVALPRPRVLVTTPFHLRTLLDAGIELPAVDLVVSATAPLSPGLARETEARCGARLVEIYGSTETGQIASRRTTQTAAWTLFPGVGLIEEHGRHWATGGHVDGKVAIDDLLELQDPDRFLLHGRSADMVNIAGKRSSLGYLNHQLCAVPGVVDGAFALPADETPDRVSRLLAAVVAPDLDHAQLVRALRERVDPAFMPRRIAFVDALPRNATGKLPSAALQALFAERGDSAPASARDTDPSSTDSAASATDSATAECTLAVPADHPAFAGHFPGAPVLPGVVLLDEALHAVREAGALADGAFRIGAAKFFQPVLPGMTIAIRHRRLANGSVEFEITSEGGRIASGRFDPAAPQP